MSHTTENLTAEDQPVPCASGKVIYTVTTIRSKGENRHNRTVGWYENREEAFACLDKNLGGLVEAGYYQYAVVEKVPNGLYPDSVPRPDEQRRWFWKSVGDSLDNEHWERIDDEPAELLPEGAGGWTAYCQIG